MDRVLRWLEFPIHALMWIGILAGAAMMIHVSVDVAGRTLFNHPFEGTTEIVSGYYMVAAAYLPWAYLARSGGHIRVELFYRLFPRGLQAALDPLVDLLTIAYLSVFVWQTWLRAEQQTLLGEVMQAGSSFVPVWPSRWILPIAGGMMVLYMVVKLARDVAHGARDGR